MLDLDMGKYALFVWSAYGVTLVAFIGMIGFSLSFSGKWRRRAESLKASADRDGDK